MNTESLDGVPAVRKKTLEASEVKIKMFLRDMSDKIYRMSQDRGWTPSRINIEIKMELDGNGVAALRLWIV